MEEQTEGRSVFGRVLGAIMEARGMDADDPEQVKALDERSGLVGEEVLANFRDGRRPYLGDLGGLAGELGMSKTEMRQLAHAYALGKEVRCSEPGCERPAVVGDELGDCDRHREAYDALADLEAWRFAQRILEPWMGVVREIGHDELTRVMEKALAEVEGAVAAGEDRLERAESAAD